MVVRREHLDRAGPFDEDMWVGEDTDLVLRLAGLTTFCGVSEPLIVMERGHTDRLSLDYERHREGAYAGPDARAEYADRLAAELGLPRSFG